MRKYWKACLLLTVLAAGCAMQTRLGSESVGASCGWGREAHTAADLESYDVPGTAQARCSAEKIPEAIALKPIYPAGLSFSGVPVGRCIGVYTRKLAMRNPMTKIPVKAQKIWTIQGTCENV